MAKKIELLHKYGVPVVAILVVVLQLTLVRENNLTRWKGGGFGMYSEMHFNYNEVFISSLVMPIDSLKKTDKKIANQIKILKRIPSTSNLKVLAQLISSYSPNDTVTVQVWRPILNSKKASYSRELINEFHYLKR